MSGLDALLNLQEHDLKIEQLEHKLATLPERQAVEANAAALSALERDAIPVHERRDELTRDQKRLEDEVASVEAHAAQVYDKLYNSGTTSPKELQALQQDHDSLKRRQRELEDKVIGLMEATEPVDGSLVDLDSRRRALDAEGQAALVALTEAVAQTETELQAAQGERADVAAQVPAELLVTYDKLRPSFGGIAVARLVGTQCGGCHLTLSSMAMANARKQPEDAVVLCDECGRILVR